MRGNSSVVEHNLAKVGVASSSLVSRSRFPNLHQILYIGCVAEGLCSGLQSRGRRFDSDRSLQLNIHSKHRKDHKPAPLRVFYVCAVWSRPQALKSKLQNQPGNVTSLLYYAFYMLGNNWILIPEFFF